MNRSIKRLLLAGVMAGALGSAAYAVTATNTFQATITIQTQCEVTSPSDLNFGSSGLLNNNIDASSTFVVKCTKGTAYSIGLTGANDSGGNKRMSNGSEYVTYQTYTDNTYGTVWDAASSPSSGPVTATGTGDNQTYTVYGRVPPQTTPPAGNYSDTVTITVQY